MRRALEERLALLQRELREVDLQEVAGELDSATADRLRATYRAERDIAQTELRDIADDVSAPPPRNPRRMLVGAGILIVSFIIIVIAAVGALSEGQAPVPGQTDLSQISNEAMSAVIDANQDNPQVNAMRLALGERYFQEFDYSSALLQYQAVMDNDPSSAEASEALARMGWMVHASGASDVAENLLASSLEADPANIEANWFLSIVYLDTDRPCEAAALLESLRTDPSIPAESAGDVVQVFETATERCEA